MIRAILFLTLSFLVTSPQSASLRRLSTGTPDTLEIYVIRVEFKKEEKDNSLTTGRGLFGSDEDTASANYSLDPQRSRASEEYWLNHIEFANNYFQAASNGKLVIEPKVFPKSGNSRSYQLDKYIIDYNRTTKRKDEKTAEFDDAKTKDYMSFVWDAVKKASANKEDSPFSDSLPSSPNRKRAFMIIHAGASRLVDGGNLGTTGADTPGDFFDAFVVPFFWSYLNTDSLRKADTLGIALPGTAIDTLKEIMVMSETASQDGLNWGINGVLVHQIARQIGMPATYDTQKGISRLGYFDVMDYAGYNAGNGFLPVLPSAWVRAYMGWSTVRELKPGTNLQQALEIAATGSGAGDEILKVPLTANEYLLLENRQRTLEESGKVTITLDNGSEKEYQVDSLHRVFQDSVCDKNGENCKRNSNKATGTIVKTSHYDMALPASGVLVWHINDWLLNESLRAGTANYWAGEAVRDHHFGISLVEADKVLSIGKEFKNALGETVQDFGSGSDLLPHLRMGNKDAKFDTVSTIEPTGYANTATTFGALSGIRISVGLPANAKKEATANSFMGDSVTNWHALKFPLRVEWNGQWLEKAEWPRQIMDDALPGHMVSLAKPQGASGSYHRFVVIGSQDGTLHSYLPNGSALMPTDTTIYRDYRYDSVSTLLETAPSLDSAKTIALHRFAPSHGALVGLAATGNAVVALHAHNLVLHQVSANSSGNIVVTPLIKALSKTAILGPMVVEGKFWFADSATLRSATPLSSGAGWQAGDSIAWPSGFVPHSFAWCGTGLAVVGTNGRVLSLQAPANSWTSFAEVVAKGEYFQMVCSDFNRDGNADAFVLGDLGTGYMVSLTEGRLLSPVRKFKRGTDGKVFYSDRSPPAIADINGDALPDVVFYGHNLLYAIDSSGVPLQGFPAGFGRGLPEYGFGETPIVVNADSKGNPEILAATTGGILHAFDSKGAMLRDGWPRLVADFRYVDTAEALHPVGLMLSDADTSKGMELFSSHYDQMQGFGFQGSSAGVGKSWLLAGGSLERLSWFDASKLPEYAAEASSQRIEAFSMFPNPVRHGLAKVRFTLGAPASQVILRWYDIGGKEVLNRNLGEAGAGRNQVESIDCKQLGSDLYAVSIEVHFVKGKKKLAWDRVAVVR